MRSTVGISNIVRFGDAYAIVPDSEGPFDRLEGVFECHESEEQVVILIEVLGRVTRVRLLLAQAIPEPAY